VLQYALQPAGLELKPNPGPTDDFPQIAEAILVLNCTHVGEGTMKDPHSVLRHKGLDLERVRTEIQALLTVIPLLADDPPSADAMNQVPVASCPTPVDPPDNDMAQLELYYPFVRYLGISQPEKR